MVVLICLIEIHTVAQEDQCRKSHKSWPLCCKWSTLSYRDISQQDTLIDRYRPFRQNFVHFGLDLDELIIATTDENIEIAMAFPKFTSRFSK